jgi:hypothetical protein
VSLLPVWRRLTLYAVISLFLFFFLTSLYEIDHARRECHSLLSLPILVFIL